MKKEKVAIAFQGLQPGETFSNKNPPYYRILFLKKGWNETAEVLKALMEKTQAIAQC